MDRLSFTEVWHDNKELVDQCQSLRWKVFVEEQGIPSDIELDGKDHSPSARHVVVMHHDSNENHERKSTTPPSSSVIGTGRIIFPSPSEEEGHNDTSATTAYMGRIAVLREWRNQGIGKKIVLELEKVAMRQLSSSSVSTTIHRLRLTPHHYLEAFYKSLGFYRIAGAERTINGGCQLITMEKQLVLPPSTTTDRLPSKPQSSMHRKRRICCFGTSANPPTGRGGHVGVVEALLQWKDPHPFDEIMVLPVYRHTFASKRDQLLDFDHRVAMCRLAFSNLSPRVVVSRAEERSFERLARGVTSEEEMASLRVGTADLLEMLLQEEQQGAQNGMTTEFSFCLGADTFMDLTDWKWKRSKDVLRLLEGRLVVIHRKGVAHEKELQERVHRVNTTMDGQVIFLDVPELKKVSSSMARQITDVGKLKKVAPPDVADYIVSHQLYGFETPNKGRNDER